MPEAKKGDSELVVVADKENSMLDQVVQLGSMNLSPRDVIVYASAIAKELAKVIEDQAMFSNINGNRYVKVEGWETLAAMLGLTPRERYVKSRTWSGADEFKQDSEREFVEYEAYVELVRNTDGMITGGASAICATNEITRPRNGAPHYRWETGNAPRSMALTRATSKALRVALAWVITMAGYKPTPAEEMDMIIDGEVRDVTPKGKKAQPAAKPAQKLERPLAPHKLEEAFEVKIKKLTADGFTKLSKTELANLRGALLDIYSGNEDALTTFLRIFGSAASDVDELSTTRARVLLDWLALDDKGEPNEHSVAEAIGALHYASEKIAQGQGGE